MRRDIRNFNTKGQRHGYQEWHTNVNQLWYKGNHKNGQPIGYSISNPFIGGIGDNGTEVNFYIR